MGALLTKTTRVRGVDTAALVRGAYRGFLVLIAGTVVFPLVAGNVPGIASWWLTAVCIAGFSFAALHQGYAQWPLRQAVAAALSANFLVLPLLLGGADWDVVAVTLMGATAIACGAAVGAVLLIGRRLATRRVVAFGGGRER